MSIFRKLFGGSAGEDENAQQEDSHRRDKLDAHGQPLRREFNAARLNDRAIDELIGLCKGVLADGQVTQEEGGFLESWIRSNRSGRDSWPATVLFPRLQAMLKDGILDVEEQGELLELLIDTTGGLQTTRMGNVVNMSTSLPFDDPPPEIVFSGRRFCLTGKFVTGTRKKCQELITDRGGVTQSTPSSATDFLVVGVIGSTDWIHSTHGRKIEKARDLREKQHSIAIVSEEHWFRYLQD